MYIYFHAIVITIETKSCVPTLGGFALTAQVISATDRSKAVVLVFLLFCVAFWFFFFFFLRGVSC